MPVTPCKDSDPWIFFTAQARIGLIFVNSKNQTDVVSMGFQDTYENIMLKTGNYSDIYK